MNEATTKPFEDYRSFIPSMPRQYEVFQTLLEVWRNNPDFYDIHKNTNTWKVEFKYPPREGDDHPQWGVIVYYAEIHSKLDPQTGDLVYYLKANMHDMNNDVCREMAKKDDWKFVLATHQTPLRGVPVGKETIWSYTEDGLAKIARVARDIDQASTLKKRLLSGEL